LRRSFEACFDFRCYGSQFRVYGLGCRVWGSVYTLPETEAGFDFKFEGLRCRVFMVRIWGLGFRDRGLGFRLKGSLKGAPSGQWCIAH